MVKISFSFKLFSDHFYGQSLIKTVRGPLNIHGYYWKTIGNDRQITEKIVVIPLKLDALNYQTKLLLRHISNTLWFNMHMI